MRKDKPAPRRRTTRKPRPFSDVSVVPEDDEAVIGPGNEPQQAAYRPWTQEEIEAALNCTRHGDVTRLAKLLGRSTQSVRHMRHKRGAEKIRPSMGGGGGPQEVSSYTSLMRRIWDEHERTQRLP